MLCKNIKDILNSTYGPKVQLKKGTQKGKKNDQGLKIDYIQGMTKKLRACLEGTTIDKKGMRRIKKFRIKQHISSRCSPQRLSSEKIKSDKTSCYSAYFLYLLHGNEEQQCLTHCLEDPGGH